MSAVTLLDDPDRLASALSPLRRRILDSLHEPGSATELAGRLGLARQKVNYHLRVLEDLGLAELVEVRRRRGFTERVLRRTAELVVDPGVLASPAAPGSVAQRDAYAADHLVALAGATVRDVTRMQTAAAAQDRRLLTFAVETEVRFARPADVHGFTDAVAAALASVAAQFHAPAGRPYRVVVGGHPAPRPPDEPGATP